MGAGYEIPISVSYARTETVNPILYAGTTFNFDSPWASGGSNDQTSRLTTSATATSSAAVGGPASSATQAATNANGTDNPDSLTSTPAIPSYVWLGVGGIVLFLLYKKFV